MSTADALKSQPSREDEPKKSKVLMWVKVVLGVIAIVVIGVLLYIFRDEVSEYSSKFIEWVKNNLVLGSILLIIIYTIATVSFIPGSILTVGAGWAYTKATSSIIWGTLIGSVCVFLGATLGCILAFLVGRYIFYSAFQTVIKKYKGLLALDRALINKGLKVMLLLRLSPIVPFNMLNYVLSITSVSFLNYTLGCIAMIPGTVFYVYLGSSLDSISDVVENKSADSITRLILYAVGGVLALIVIFYVAYLAKKELNKMAEVSNPVEKKDFPPPVNTNDSEEHDEPQKPDYSQELGDSQE